MTPRRVDGGGDPRFLRAAIVCFVAAMACLALLLLSGCSLKSAQIGFAGVQAGDLISTHVAESRGAVEKNPVMQTSWPTRIVLKSVSTVTVVYVTSRLAQMGHKKLARGLLYALNATLISVSVNNFRVVR